MKMRRVLALILAVVLCVGCLPMGAFADASGGEENGHSHPSYHNRAYFHGTGTQADPWLIEYYYDKFESQLDSVNAYVAGNKLVVSAKQGHKAPVGDTVYCNMPSGSLYGDNQTWVTVDAAFWPWNDVRGSITEVEISGISTIGSYAFCDMPKLQSVTMDSAAMYIQASAFANDTALQNVSWENMTNLTAIGWQAFSLDSALASPEFPASLERIDTFAFSGCKSFRTITLPRTTNQLNIGSDAFTGCDPDAVVVLGPDTSFGGHVFAWANGTGIDENNEEICRSISFPNGYDNGLPTYSFSGSTNRPEQMKYSCNFYGDMFDIPFISIASSLEEGVPENPTIFTYKRAAAAVQPGEILWFHEFPQNLMKNVVVLNSVDQKIGLLRKQTGITFKAVPQDYTPTWVPLDENDPNGAGYYYLEPPIRVPSLAVTTDSVPASAKLSELENYVHVPSDMEVVAVIPYVVDNIDRAQKFTRVTDMEKDITEVNNNSAFVADIVVRPKGASRYFQNARTVQLNGVNINTSRYFEPYVVFSSDAGTAASSNGRYYKAASDNTPAAHYAMVPWTIIPPPNIVETAIDFTQTVPDKVTSSYDFSRQNTITVNTEHVSLVENSIVVKNAKGDYVWGTLTGGETYYVTYVFVCDPGYAFSSKKDNMLSAGDAYESTIAKRNGVELTNVLASNQSGYQDASKHWNYAIVTYEYTAPLPDLVTGGTIYLRNCVLNGRPGIATSNGAPFVGISNIYQKNESGEYVLVNSNNFTFKEPGDYRIVAAGQAGGYYFAMSADGVQDYSGPLQASPAAVSMKTGNVISYEYNQELQTTVTTLGYDSSKRFDDCIMITWDVTIAELEKIESVHLSFTVPEVDGFPTATMGAGEGTLKGIRLQKFDGTNYVNYVSWDTASGSLPQLPAGKYKAIVVFEAPNGKQYASQTTTTVFPGSVESSPALGESDTWVGDNYTAAPGNVNIGFSYSSPAKYFKAIWFFDVGANVAEIVDGARFETLADAVEVAQSGDTVRLLAESADSITLPVGVTFNTNGNSYTGTVSAPDGYKVVSTGTAPNVVYTVEEIHYVAQIGTTKYETLAAAVSEVQPDQTIVLLNETEETITLPVGVTYDTDGKGHGAVSAPENYVVKNDNGVYTVVAAVAKIGTTYYETLAAAVADVPTDGTETTITLLKDIDLGTASTTLKAGTNVILDTNGKTVTSAIKGSSNGTLNASGKLKITGGGTIANTSSNGYVVKLKATADVTLDDAILKSTVSTNGAVDGGSGRFVMESGTVESVGTGIAGKNIIINGGSVTSTSGYAAYANSSSGTVTVNGGTITGASAKGDVGVYSGNVIVSEDAILTNEKISFTSNAYGLILADTAEKYIPESADLGVYDGDILIGYMTSNTTATSCPAMNGKTVKLLKNINGTLIVIGSDVTIDLNGHNITSNKEYAINVRRGSSSSVRNVTIKGEGNVSCNNGGGCVAVYVDWFVNLTIEDGTYSVGGEADNTTIYIIKSDHTAPTTVNITGGVFPNSGKGWTLNVNDDARSEGGNFVVTGGIFYQFNPENCESEGPHTNFVAEGYCAMPYGTNPGDYQVVRCTHEAQINGLHYATLTDAVDAAQPEQTILLLKETDTSITLPVGVTFDTNGNRYTGTVSAPDGYKVVSTGTAPNVVYTVEEIHYVAEIVDGARFETLAGAVEAAQSGNTVRLLADIAYGEFEGTALDIPTGKSFTLELNGKTISGTATNASTSQLINISKGTTVVIQDSSANAAGKITYSSTQPDPAWTYGTYTINNAGTLTLKSGRIENNTRGGASYAIENHANWQADDVTFNMEGGVVTCPDGDQAVRLYSNWGGSMTKVGKSIMNMTGGTIEAGGIWVNDQVANGNGGYIELTISDGTVNGMLDFIGANDQTKVTITGGTFDTSNLRLRNSQTCNNTKPYVNISGGQWTIRKIQNQNANGQITNTMTVTGGIFYGCNPQDFRDAHTDYTAEGYCAIPYGTNPGDYQVVRCTHEAQIKGLHYATLTDAVNAANTVSDNHGASADMAITLIKSGVSGSYYINKGVTVFENNNRFFGTIAARDSVTSRIKVAGELPDRVWSCVGINEQFTVIVTDCNAAPVSIDRTTNYSRGEYCTVGIAKGMINAGYTFKGWKVNDSIFVGTETETGYSYSFAVHDDAVITALFDLDSTSTWSLTVIPGEHGTVSHKVYKRADASETEVTNTAVLTALGSDNEVVLTAVPDSGYIFDRWVNNGLTISRSAVVTVTKDSVSAWTPVFVEPANANATVVFTVATSKPDEVQTLAATTVPTSQATSVEQPVPNSFLGYDFAGWVVEINGAKYEVSNGSEVMTSAELDAAIAEINPGSYDSKTISITAKYDKRTERFECYVDFKIGVEGDVFVQTEDGKLVKHFTEDLGNVMKLTASEEYTYNEQTYHFSHWLVREGSDSATPVVYNTRVISLCPNVAKTYYATAVYVTATVTEQNTVTILNVYPETVNGVDKIAVTMSYSVARGATANRAGFVINKQGSTKTVESLIPAELLKDSGTFTVHLSVASDTAKANTYEFQAFVNDTKAEKLAVCYNNLVRSTN